MADKKDSALRKLEDVVDTMTDMAHIRRNSHTHSDENKMEFSPAMVRAAIEAFDLFDKDNSEGLDIAQLASVFRALGQNPTDCELRTIMRENDLNHNGVLERAEFEEMIVKYMKPMHQVEEELKDAFRIFDRDGNGQINSSELEYVLKRFGEPLTHRQSKELIGLMDKDHDGMVNLDDFVKFLCEVDQPDFFVTHYPNSRRNSFARYHKNPHEDGQENEHEHAQQKTEGVKG